MNQEVEREEKGNGTRAPGVAPTSAINFPTSQAWQFPTAEFPPSEFPPSVSKRAFKLSAVGSHPPWPYIRPPLYMPLGHWWPPCPLATPKRPRRAARAVVCMVAVSVRADSSDCGLVVCVVCRLISGWVGVVYNSWVAAL